MMKILGTNFKKIKAQHSMEILILVAFISLFVIFLLFTYTEIRSAFGRSTLDASAQDLTNQLNRIAATGSDTQYKISLNLPRNLEQVDYSDGFLTFMADETVLSYPVRSPIVGEIGSIGNVNAEFLPSNYGGYVCIYPPHKYQECCVDLLCSLNQLDCYVNGAKDTDCDGMPDWYDLDIDGDGTPNEFDPNISNKFISNPDFYLDKDENGIYEWYKNNIDLFLVNWGVDSDGDGVPDFFDKDPNNPNVGAEDNNNNNIADWLEFDFNNNGIPDWYDNDLDGDGVPNIFDSNPHHPLVGNETNPHTNVPLWLEIDTNNDGIPDWYSIDKDGDSVPDKFDDYPLDSTRGNEDNTGDGYPDWLTQDTSGDGIPDWWYGNYLDSDGNGVPDRFDASPFNPEIGNEDYYTMQYNPDGTCNMIYGSNGIPDWMEFDFDCDGVPDYIDWDIDGDGVSNEWDANPYNPEIGNEDYYTMQYNPDGSCEMVLGSNGIPDWMEFDFDCDGVPDYIDWDIDGDGVPNEWDAHPFNSNIGNEDFSGSGIPDWMEFDTSGNGIPDYLDPDIDGDGIPNYLDPNPFDPNIGPGIVQQSYPTQSFNVSECGVLNIPGIYHLVEDITTSGNCFNITVSGITFRGNGNSIISNNNGIAFHSSNVNNIIIYDTNIRNFNNAILFVNVDNALIYQNIIKSNLNWAIRLDLSKNNTIANNTIKDNDNGIYLHSPDAIYGSGMLSFPDRTTNNRIHNNIIIRSGQSIIFHGHGTHSNTVNHNIIYEGVFGIHLYAESANNSIIYNSIYDSISFGLGCDRCHYNNYYHNIIDSGLSGIDLIFKCNQNHFRNNTITNVDYGVFFRNWGDCNNNIISDSNISSLVFGVFGTNPGSYFSQHKNNSFLNITYVNESNNGRYELVRKWYLIANVTSANGTGIPNTEVILSNSSGVISQKLTNSKGHAIFDVVDYINDGPLNQFGNYTLSVGGISEEINFVNYNMVINFTDAIPIHNCIDLQNIRNDLTAHYYLANNIDCSDTINWNDGLGFEPIGDCGGNSCWEEPNNPFSGRLDGKGYIISNLSISRPEQNYVAIFSLINNSVISNLGMDSFNVIGRDVVSTLVADARDSYIEKVFSKNSYVYGRVGVGGLTGWAFNSNIINSYTNGIVIAQDAYAGGITAAHGNIYNSFSIANVSANNILGNNEGIVGGLTSEIHSAGGSISNSYFVGHVNSDSNINQYGGILGRLWGVGPNILNNVYWYNSSESIAINCYWNGNTNCNSINHLNFFMEHISNSLYSNWDIASSSNDLNNGYPYLAWQSGATNAIWLIYQPSFYEKDGTIYCYSANIGETGVVNGIVYTAYNNTGLYSIRNNASLLESACTSHVTSFQVLFMNSGSSFQPNINHWDTSSVTNMFQMFAYSGFDQEISNWDTSSVTDMIQMFAYSSFNQQISYWNTSSVNNMAGMFYNAFRFNQDLSAWCVSNIGSKPGNFDFGSSFENQNHLHPQWGLCP